MNKMPAIFAHRGARLIAPENTLPAFAAALELGADGIELDIHASKDDQLVVIHDFTLEHTTNGVGNVADMTAAELTRLDAGSYFAPNFAGVSIPTLDQVLDLVGDRCRLNIEIKSMDPWGGDAVEPLVKLIRLRNLHDQVIVSSFNTASLFHVRWLDPQIEIGMIFAEPPSPFVLHLWFSPLLTPEALHPHSSLIDEPFMAWARKKGCAVNGWTVNEVDEARRLTALGVDVITTDAPDLIRRGLLDVDSADASGLWST